MKSFIIICIFFMALASANCDPISDQKALLAKLTSMYANMTNVDIKSHIENSVKSIISLMDSAVKNYAKENLHLVATIDLTVMKYINTGLPKLLNNISNFTDEKLKHADYVQLGVISEYVNVMAKEEDKKRAAHPINVTDTTDNLLKDYKQKYNEFLEMDKWAEEQEQNKKELELWANMHQNIYDFMASGLKEIEEALKGLSKETQAKNLQVMVEDLRFMNKVFVARPRTFYAKFSEKVHEIYTKVKDFFSNYF